MLTLFYFRTQKDRPERLMLARIPTDLLYAAILKQKSCRIDVFSTVMRLLNLPNPMIDFCLGNIQKIKTTIKRDITIYRVGNFIQPLYDSIRKKYEKNLFFVVADDEVIFKDFTIHFQDVRATLICRKTETCQYVARDMPMLRRHEKICTDQQAITNQLVHYGDDKTIVKRLVDLNHLPQESLNFRKTFITTYDIEALEDLSAAEGMKNVEAIHRIVSIACSTNKGHSRCFVRQDSSNEAAMQMIEKFLSYLDEINVDHNNELPNYFHHAVEKMEKLTAENSNLTPREKMELSSLLGPLKKYLLHDVYGFNSGMFSIQSKFFLFLVS